MRYRLVATGIALTEEQFVLFAKFTLDAASLERCAGDHHKVALMLGRGFCAHGLRTFFVPYKRKAGNELFLLVLRTQPVDIASENLIIDLDNKDRAFIHSHPLFRTNPKFSKFAEACILWPKYWEKPQWVIDVCELVIEHQQVVEETKLRMKYINERRIALGKVPFPDEDVFFPPLNIPRRVVMKNAGDKKVLPVNQKETPAIAL